MVPLRSSLIKVSAKKMREIFYWSINIVENWLAFFDYTIWKVDRWKIRRYLFDVKKTIAFIINQKFTIYKIENVDFDHAIMSNCIKNIFNNVENFYFSPMKYSAEAGNSHTSKECHVNSAHISTHIYTYLHTYLALYCTLSAAYITIALLSETFNLSTVLNDSHTFKLFFT